jgi:hypothetical protein
MKTKASIAVWRLNENAVLTLTFCEDFPSKIVESDSPSNVSSSTLDRMITIHVGEKTKTEPFRGRGVCKAINDEVGLRSLEYFTDSVVEFVVSD